MSSFVVTLPVFSQIHIADVKKNLDTLLKKNLDTIEVLLNQHKMYSWENLLQPIENLNDALHQFWGPIQHLNAVVNSHELRDVMHLCIPALSDYQMHISHNEKLFHAMNSIKNSSEFKKLSEAKQKSIENDLRDFKLNGIHLSPEKKERFSDLSKSLSQLMQQFEENVLDATMDFKKHIMDEKLLSGIPLHAKNAARNNAKKVNKEGFLFTLEAPDYLAIMLHADSSQLRKEFYYAYVTRASDQGPSACKFDNTKVMQLILSNRFELARLLGFQNYAEYSLTTKMVKKTGEVLAFLNELAKKSFSKAKTEFQILSEFAKKELGMQTLKAWDVAYVSEKLRLKEYAISPEDLRPYFPEQKVLSGLFDIIYRLYKVTLKKVNVDVWHPDVKCFQIIDHNENLQAHLFFDLYARANKRGGAWMDECMMRRELDDGKIQLPAAYVTCNFNGPIGNDPALFSHDNVVTLFHECGHALQHVLTKIDVAAVSGIHGIPWDAIEVASQFFENWAWEKKSIPYFSEHYQTHTALPNDLFLRMDHAKNFQSAMQMVRQLEFAIFDFRLHMEYNDNNPSCIQEILNAVRKKIIVFPLPKFNRFQHSFTHIFGGNYGAGYYSYKWAEVMACDAFALFEEKDIFDSTLSEKFKTTFLESGGAKEPMDLFIAFRGRKPTVDALLQQSGITV